MTYVEDSTPPPAPVVTATDPPSPASDLQPAVIGTAAVDVVTVGIYLDDPTCAGDWANSGLRADFIGGGVSVDVAGFHTTQIRTRGFDAAGNSQCSAPFDYVETTLGVFGSDFEVGTATDLQM